MHACTSWLPFARWNFVPRIDVLTYLYFSPLHIHIDRIFLCVAYFWFFMCVFRPASSSSSSTEAIVISLLGKQLRVVCIAHERFCFARSFLQFHNCRRCHLIGLHSIDRQHTASSSVSVTKCESFEMNVNIVSRRYRSNHHSTNFIPVKHTLHSKA